MEYLGHVISVEGLAIGPTNVESMLSWPRPTIVRGLQGLLGITGYYSIFFTYYGKICQPFTSLLKQDNFLWNEEAKDVFN